MNANFELAIANRSAAIKQSYATHPELRQLRAETFGKAGRIRVEVFKHGVSLGVFDSQIEAAAFLGIKQSLVSAYMHGRIVNKSGITVKQV